MYSYAVKYTNILDDSSIILYINGVYLYASEMEGTTDDMLGYTPFPPKDDNLGGDGDEVSTVLLDVVFACSDIEPHF